MNKCKCTGIKCRCYTGINKPCPGCKRLIERTEACNHMTCKCGCEFCWTCGGPFVGNLPAYSGRFESTGCQSNVCKYYGPARDGYCVERVEVLRVQPAGPAVEVRGAGSEQVNGWYLRKEHAQGPPAGWPECWDWAQCNEGRRWYEKDGGCFIYQTRSRWYILTPDGRCHYLYTHGRRDTPPSGGHFSPWKVINSGCAPPPTLRVVNH